MPNKGDLVVYRYSKGLLLKNKVLKVIEAHIDYSTGVRVISPSGKQSVHTSYELIPLDQYEQMLQSKLIHAEWAVEAAQRGVAKAHKMLTRFREEKDKAKDWFPKV